MLKWIGTGVVLAAAVAAATTLVVAKAAPEPGPVATAKPPSVDKPLGRICRSDEIVDSRPSPAELLSTTLECLDRHDRLLAERHLEAVADGAAVAAEHQLRPRAVHPVGLQVHAVGW